MIQENVFQEFGRKSFQNLKKWMVGTALACLATSPAIASDTRVALVPGGPHPYFAAWEKAGQDAKRDFGLSGADYRVLKNGNSASRTSYWRACSPRVTMAS